MRPRIYVLALSAVGAAVFAGIVAANVIIDPQGIFGLNLIPHTFNINHRVLTFMAYRAAEDRYDGLVFGSSRAWNVPRDELSDRMNGVRFAGFGVDKGLLTDHLPVLEYALRPVSGNRKPLRAVFLLIDIDNFGTTPVTNQYNNTVLPPALTGENVVRFWWRQLVSIQYQSWRSTIREVWTGRAPSANLDQPPRVRHAMFRSSKVADDRAADAPSPGPGGADPRSREKITSRAGFAGQLKLFERLSKMCRDNNVALVVALSPLHPANEILYDPADVSRAIDRMSRITPIWDFTNSASHTNRPGLWLDTSHFSVEVQRLMLRQIFREPMPAGWEDFGRRREHSDRLSVRRIRAAELSFRGLA